MSIRSVDMQHTLQQVAAAERVQAVGKDQAEQQAQQFSQQLERAEDRRRHSVPQTEHAEPGRVTASKAGERERRKRKRRPAPVAPAPGPEPSPPPAGADGEVHLIDIRA